MQQEIGFRKYINIRIFIKNTSLELLKLIVSSCLNTNKKLPSERKENYEKEIYERALRRV